MGCEGRTPRFLLGRRSRRRMDCRQVLLEGSCLGSANPQDKDRLRCSRGWTIHVHQGRLAPFLPDPSAKRWRSVPEALASCAAPFRAQDERMVKPVFLGIDLAWGDRNPSGLAAL